MRFGRVESDIAKLRGDTDQLRKDTTEELRRVGGDITKLRGDTDQLRKDTTELRAEFKARDDRLGRTLERIEKALPPSPRAN
jgi:hypothetical protein